jgi:hypothetical protein
MGGRGHFLRRVGFGMADGNIFHMIFIQVLFEFIDRHSSPFAEGSINPKPVRAGFK